MDKIPISLDEKIEARFTRKGKGACWPWNGSIGTDRRPQVNLRDVIRFIYEKERGPIPPGMILRRMDHDRRCDRRSGVCSHQVCVNPWHVEPHEPALGPTWGLYLRNNPWPGDDTSHAVEYQRRSRAGRKKRSNDGHGDQKDFDDTSDGGGREGFRLAEPDVSESAGEGHLGGSDREPPPLP